MRNIVATLATLVATSCAAGQPAAQASHAPPAAVAVAETCEMFSQGSERFVAAPSLRLAHLKQDEPFVLPREAPADLGFVRCQREKLLPLPQDYTVLAAGYPLVIASGGRVAVLEVSEGRVNFRAITGEFSAAEIPVIQAYLNRVQPLLDRPGNEA